MGPVDFSGRVIETGAFVVHSTRQGSSLIMDWGLVVAIRDESVKVVKRASRVLSSFGNTDRLIVIDTSHVPEEVQVALGTVASALKGKW